MHIIKPLWLKHGGEKKDFEVYSCHVSANGLRLVTAGGDGYVRIWSMEAIYNASISKYKTKPKQLAALSPHSGTIHTVRFSGNNKYLASGADDKIVCVYWLDPNPPSHAAFGTNETPPVENWRILIRLIGHENDVQDLAWSYDSSILVSVGLDSRVVVWSGYSFEKLKVLSQHGSHVKGITFDPANKYFATASDDRTIKVFRFTSPAPNATAYDQTNNFMLETTIQNPFLTSPLTTYFRRCSWSPDGNHIAAANAVNGPVSTAAIINRGTWESDINLVGHEAPVEVCAFSPRIFSKIPPSEQENNEEARQYDVTVIACAGQDRAISIWNTTNPKPLVINEQLCMKAISDLAWSPDGERLFFTSLDGTIAFAVFSAGELGYPVPLEVNQTSLAKYGAGRKVGVVEGPDGLLLEEKSRIDELRNVQGRMGELMGDRHTPQGTSPIVLSNGSKPNGFASVSNDKPPATNGTALTNGHAATDIPASEPPAKDSNAVRVERLKQRVTITKDGKKRVAPLLISSAAGGMESSLPRSQLMSATNQGTRNDAPQHIIDLSKPYEGFPKGGLASLLVGNKRKLAELEGEDDGATTQRIATTEREGTSAILMNTADGLTLPHPSLTQSVISTRPSVLSPSLIISQVRLAVPDIRGVLIRPLLGQSRVPQNGTDANRNTGAMDDVPVLEVRNWSESVPHKPAQNKDPARITVTKRGQILWHDFLPKAVSLVTGNPRFWAASCEDGSVYLWSPAGRRLFNAFTIESQACILDCRGPWLLCISAVGLCHVWNVPEASSPHPPISLAPVLDIAVHSQGPHLTNGPGIIFARLTSEGRIIVAMSNGDAYAYSLTMYIWQRLSEPWWAVGSQYWNSRDPTGNLAASSSRATDTEKDDEVRPENISAGIIPLLERNTTSQILLRGRAYFLQRLVKSLLSAEGYEGFESGVSVAHLENRVAAALTLGARDEFKLYLSMYAKRLGAEGSKLKIEELLRNLLSGIYEEQPATSAPASHGVKSGQSSDELCGWKKEVLLREVVLILGKFRDLQRITVPYARLLGITGAESGDHDMEST